MENIEKERSISIMCGEANRMEQSMDIVFEHAKVKALIRNRKLGNTNTHWSYFTTEHLSNRLDEEFLEWKESQNSQELLDIKEVKK